MKKNKTVHVKEDVDSQALFLNEQSSFAVQEAFKTLRTNVMFSMPSKGCKCIGVTSANRGEGKSSISVNLALSFAQLQKKVLIIDCDMRLPTVASKLNIESAPGLSNCLAGLEEDDHINIQHLEDRGIDVLAAGNIPPDSTVLLESENMVNLIKKLKQTYDYIIFDFPPVMIVSDAVILANNIDGYLVVVRQNISEFKKVEETMRQMNFARAKLIGFVFNGKTSDGLLKKGGKYYKYSYYKKSE